MSANGGLAESTASLQSVTTKRLFIVGDIIAKREGYEHLEGIEAVYFYLIQKHHWLPSQVRSLNVEDLYFCVQEDDDLRPL